MGTMEWGKKEISEWKRGCSSKTKKKNLVLRETSGSGSATACNFASPVSKVVTAFS